MYVGNSLVERIYPGGGQRRGVPRDSVNLSGPTKSGDVGTISESASAHNQKVLEHSQFRTKEREVDRSEKPCHRHVAIMPDGRK